MMPPRRLGRRLYRQVGGLLTFEDAIDVAGGAPKLVDDVGSVGDQAAVDGEDTQGTDRRQSMPGSQRNDQLAVPDRLGEQRHDQPAVRGSRKRRNRALELARVAQLDRGQIHGERWRHRLHGSDLRLAAGVPRVENDRHALHARGNVLEQLQPFRANAVFDRGNKARRVASGLVEAGDETGADRGR
jgi:hypothetical protein